MNCPNEQTLSAFYDGELSPAEMAQARSHAASCDACREVLALLEQASTLVKNAQLSDVSPQMISRWASVGTVVQDRALRRLVGSLTGIAASVLIVASIARQQASESSLPTIGEWEQVAFAGGDDEGDDSHVAARFMAADLSMRSNEASPRGGERP